MADSGPGGGNVGFVYEVVDEASAPLGKIEKSYNSVMDSMTDAMKELTKAMKQKSDATEDAADSAEDHQEETKKSQGKFGELTDALGENKVGLDKLGISWSNFIKFIAAASVVGGLLAIGAMFKKIFDMTIEFRRAVLGLNEAFAGNSKEMGQVYGVVAGLNRRFGMTREEVVAMTRSMLELGLTPRVLGKQFRRIAGDIQAFASATGLGTGEAAKFADQMISINKIPAIKIRGMANAIKSVADASRISAGELVSLNESLEPLMSMMVDQSPEARRQFTLSMIGISGALKDAGLDASKLTAGWADMLDTTSATGAAAAGRLGNFIGRGADEIKELIRQDPAKLFDDIAQRAKNLDPSQLDKWSMALEGVGISREDLRRFSIFGKEGKTTFAQAAEAAKAASEREDELARKAARRQERLDAAMNRLKTAFENLVLKIGNKLVPIIENKLVPLLLKAADAINNIKAGEVADTWDNFWTMMGENVDDTKTLTKAAFSDIGSFIGNAAASGAAAWDGFLALWEGNNKKAGDSFGDMATGAAIAFTDILLGPIKDYLKDWGYDIDEIFHDIGDSIGRAFTKAFEISGKVMDDFLEGAKRIGEFVGKMFADSFEGIFESVSDIIDRLLIQFVDNVAPWIAKLPGVGDNIAEAMKAGGAAAKTRVDARTAKAKKAERVSSALAGAAGAPALGQSTSTSTKFPGSMTTSSPGQEALQRETNRQLGRVVGVLSSSNGGMGASGLKLAGVRARAGG